MNEEKNRFRFSAIIAAFILGGAIVGGFCAIFNSENKSDYNRIEQYQQRERELLTRIGEYQQREEERTARERERIAREDRRIRAERERVARTETQLRTIWGFGGREHELREELTKEINILADFFFSVKRDLDNAANNSSGEIGKTGSE
jgi:septal ring factor EnvC (AmiA/AmiB activator)